MVSRRRALDSHHPICRPGSVKRPRRMLGLVFVVSCLALLRAVSLEGQACTDINPPPGIPIWSGDSNPTISRSCNCSCVGDSGYRCYQPINLGVGYTTTGGCDPRSATCNVQARVTFQFPGNKQSLGYGPGLDWRAPSGTQTGTCGGFTKEITEDQGVAILQISGYSCTNPDTSQAAGTYSVIATSCFQSSCGHPALTVPVNLSVPALWRRFCARPLPSGCAKGRGGAAGGSCCVGSGGSTPTTGQGPSVTPEGHPAALTYQAGGVGNDPFPGAASWRTALGRNWSHEYAERIVLDPDVGSEATVWLLTRWGTFQKFTDLQLDGTYSTSEPADDFRELTWTNPGWTLRDLDGTVEAFDGSGNWLSTTDRNLNQYLGHYTTGQLTQVDFPDGRNEVFTYYASGKLWTITQNGRGGGVRTWTYYWTGDDLTQIDRPDGRSWTFTYGDPANPGYMTRMTLVGTDASQRVEGAWAYDVWGNVVQTWKGSTSFASGFERWSFSYDDPANPTETTVTDPMNNASTQTYERDPASGKARTLSISGDCPTCGAGPNSTFDYSTSPNYFLPNSVTDARGVTTEYEYDAWGNVTKKTEAANDPFSDPDLPRVTDYVYDSTYHSFVTEIAGPYPDGGAATRIVDSAYDPLNGNLTSRTQYGNEPTYTGIYPWVTSYPDYNAAGQVKTIDPLGYGTGDQTTFTYNITGANGLLPDSRIDPIDSTINTTSFEYDSFNRRTAIVDPNGHRVETAYDQLGRVTTVTFKGDNVDPGSISLPPDLVTSYTYNVLGDLFCTEYPRGNAVRYLYDDAGRLEEVARGTAVNTPSASNCLDPVFPEERTFYTLDNYGHRTKEELSRWNGSAWISPPDATTDYNYSTRCHLDSVVRGSSTTTYDYDCAGNLSVLTEGLGSPVETTTTYGYDGVNRLTSTTQDWGGVLGGTLETHYGYDVQDHLTSVTDGEGNVTSYVYSDRDLLISENSPASSPSSYRYNPHGELEHETHCDNQDCLNPIEIARTVDEADRVTAIDYPGSEPDVAFSYSQDVYDIQNPTHQVGHLFSMNRGSIATDYGYDPYWRLVNDGELTMGLDDNGLPSTIRYPQGIETRTTYDASDRPTTLEISEDDGANWSNVVGSVSSGATYWALGPLDTLPFGNGNTETRTYDGRYLPAKITTSDTQGSLLDWAYTVDALGDITAIDDTLASNEDRSFSYQPDQRFLTSATGPWPGPLTWTYDKIGNRLTEVRGGGIPYSDTYNYTAGTSGNTALLASITRDGGSYRTYTFDGRGFLDSVDASGNVVDFTYDGAGLQNKTLRGVPPNSTELDYEYDARGFLAKAHTPTITPTPHCTSSNGVFCDDYETGDFACWSSVSGGTPGGICPWNATSDYVASTYSSAGRLYGLDRVVSGVLQRRAVLYLGDRPVAIWARSGANPSTFTYLTTDHLGTPILAMNETGAAVWSGGFEPFGEDYTASPSAQDAGVFLRLPGQWWDALFEDSTLGALQSQNLHRWYESTIGRYSSPDPLAQFLPVPRLFAYVDSNPLSAADPSGLVPVKCEACDELKKFLQGVEQIINNLRTIHQVAPEGAPTLTLARTGCANLSSIGEPDFGVTQFLSYPFATHPCIHSCIGVHERVHRRQCRLVGHDEFYASAGTPETELPAYGEGLKCLRSAVERGFLDISIHGVSY